MGQYSAEKKLLISYSLCIIMGAVTSITTGIAWMHWKPTLDQCINRNCSCILFGEHTFNRFLGGTTAQCAFVTFGSLFYLLYCIAMSCFHGYRVLFSSSSLRPRTVMRKDREGETVHMTVQTDDDSNPLPRPFWITTSCFTVFWCLYSLIHASVFLAGFYQTCNQYRNSLESLLRGLGTVLPVIHSRLSCQAVFDFMDYIQPDTGVGYNRDGYINTGVDLTLGIVCSIFSCIFFGLASLVNIKRAKTKY